MFGAPEYDGVNLAIREVSIMNVHLNTSVLIVNEAKEKCSRDEFVC